jgi:hypothetical protein
MTEAMIDEVTHDLTALTSDIIDGVVELPDLADPH